MKILLIHPGHSYSTADVFDGMKAGLEANGVEVVVYDTWNKMQLFNSWAAIVGGQVGKPQAEHLYRLGNWLASADALSLAIDHEVDAAIVINGLLFPHERVLHLRKIGIPVACYGTEAPYFHDDERRLAMYYDHWFTNERKSVPIYQEITKATYLAHAFNPLVHVPADPDPDKRCDVAFVGGGFPERRKLIDGVDWQGINLQLRGTLWENQEELSEGSISNAETRAWHRSATIALNMHRKMAKVNTGIEVPEGSAESLGPRAYEIPACGGFMLIDDERPEARDVFGESLATYRAWDSADLERQVRFWLENPTRREEMRAAQFAAIQPHSWQHRAATMLSDFLA